MSQLIEHDPDDDPDYLTIVRPRGIIRVVIGFLNRLVRRGEARDHGNTLVRAASTLAASGRAGIASCEKPGSAWTVSLSGTTSISGNITPPAPLELAVVPAAPNVPMGPTDRSAGDHA